MTTDNLVDKTPPVFVVKGHHVLVVILGFFAVIIAVNSIFITMAVRTFRGEEVERSYMQGLVYNEVLAERRTQAEMGWHAGINLVEDALILAVEDRSGDPVEGLKLEARLRHRVDMAYDQALVFTEGEPGVYRAPIPDLGEAAWIVSVSAENQPFEMEHALWPRSTLR